MNVSLADFLRHRSGRTGKLSRNGTRPATSVVMLAISCMSILGACENSPVGPDLQSEFDVTPWVTESLARDLDSSGWFVMPAGDVLYGDDILSGDEARALALAWIESHAYPDVRLAGTAPGDIMEDIHGGPIDWSTIAAEARVFVAESPYDLEQDSLPHELRRFVGPFQMVRLSDRGGVVGSMGVSIYNTDFWVRDDGNLGQPEPVISTEFSFAGVAAGSPFQKPMVPEYAARLAAEETGALVAELPILLRPNRLYFPQASMWRVALDRDVEFVSVESGSAIVSRIVYVARDGSLSLSDGVSSGDSVTHVEYGDDGERHERVYGLTLRPGMSSNFQTVVVR